MSKLKLIYILLFSIVINFKIAAQCEVNTSTASCEGGEGQLINNANLNNGVKYTWNAGTGTRSNINFNNGLLVVCGGNLSISNANFNRGTLIIGENATLNLNFNVSTNNNFTIINYGQLNVSNNFTIQGNSARVFNNNFGVINVGGTTTINNNSKFINNSVFITENLVLQGNSANALCQNLHAETYVNGNFTNNTTHTISSPDGSSCFYVEGNTLLNRDVSNNADLKVCLAPSSSKSGSADWGAAEVNSNCTTCSVALPVELLYFEVLVSGETVHASWATATEINNDFFSLERSTNGEDWEVLFEVSGAGNSTNIQHYEIQDYEPLIGLAYYRLKQTDFDGNFEYFEIKTVNFKSIEEAWRIYPNPTKDVLNLQLDRNEAIVYVSLYDLNAKELIATQMTGRQLQLNLPFEAGVYFLELRNDVQVLERRKIIVD